MHIQKHLFSDIFKAYIPDIAILIFNYVKYVFQRFSRDNCQLMAAGLAYTSLLSIVPVLSIAMALFAAFPAFAPAREALLALIFDYVVAEQNESVAETFASLIDNAGAMTGFGVVSLAFTSLLLLNTIRKSLDAIWKSDHIKSLWQRLPVYWTILTLTPLLFGASLSLTSLAITANQMDSLAAALPYWSEFAWLFGKMLPILFQAMGFSMFYWFMPSVQVSPKAALIGGLSAGILMEILKQGFGIYVLFASGQETLYGALAALPVFLTWMYLVWCVILLGAEMAAAWSEFFTDSRQQGNGAAETK